MRMDRAALKKCELQTAEEWTSRRENPVQMIQIDAAEEGDVSRCRRSYSKVPGKKSTGRPNRPESQLSGPDGQQRWVGRSARAYGRGHMKKGPDQEGDGWKWRNLTASPGVRLEKRNGDEL